MSSKRIFYLDPNTNRLTEEDTKKYFSQFGFAVFVMALARLISAYALPLLTSYLLSLYAPQLLEIDVFTDVANNVLSMISIYCIGLPVFLALSHSLPRLRPEKKKMKVGSWFGGLCVTAAAMYIGNYVSTLILGVMETFLGTVPENPVVEATEANGVIVTLIFTCILAPILEELFFRKVVCDRLIPLGEGYAIFVSAVLFGLMHQNLYQFAYAFLSGALFALIYVKTGKLIYSTLYHIIINTLGGIVAPWITSNIDLDKLMSILESYPNIADFEIDPMMLLFMFILLVYSAIMNAATVLGIIFFIRAKKRKRLKLKTGVLPPPKEHRLANIFCTTGIAASVAFFVFAFMIPIFETYLMPMLETISKKF